MNYQSNMGVYYTYNQNKQKEAARKKRNLLITLLSMLLMLLLFAWASFTYFNNPIENKNADSKSDTSEETNTNTKEETLNVKSTPMQNIDKVQVPSTNDLDAKLSIPSQEMINSTTVLDKELGLIERTTALSSVDNEFNKTIKSISNTVAHDLNSTKEKSLLRSSGTLTSSNTDLNTSLKSISERTKTAIQELNTTKEENNKEKVVVEKKLPLVMYHLYIVSAGETISSIAKSQYDDPTMSIEIIQANPDLENPNNIKEGQEILLPIVDESKSYSDILHFK